MRRNFLAEAKSMASLLADAANECILPLFGKTAGSIKSRQGSFEELVTAADLAASRYIMGRIRKAYPGSYSEEQLFEDRFEHPLIWQLDPLDGTEEFSKGMADGYALNAALLAKQKNRQMLPVAGAICIPGRGEVWYGDGRVVVGRRGGRAIRPEPKKQGAIRCYMRKVDPSKKLAQAYNKLGNALGLEEKIVQGGGSGASIAALLRGETDVVVMNYDYTKEWDIAMAEPLLKARGGFVCDLHGRGFSYNRKTGPAYPQPYNLDGYVASINFSKEEILQNLPGNLIEPRL